jgi:hypothetical protein
MLKQSKYFLDFPVQRLILKPWRFAHARVCSMQVATPFSAIASSTEISLLPGRLQKVPDEATGIAARQEGEFSA